MRPHREVDRSYRRLARRYSQMARTTVATRTTTPTPTAAKPAAPRAVPIPPKRCPCRRRLVLNDASTVTSDKVNTSNPSRRCTKRTGCDPECRGFESRDLPQTGCVPDGVHPLSALVVVYAFVATRTGDVAPSVIVADPGLFETRAG